MSSKFPVPADLAEAGQEFWRTATRRKWKGLNRVDAAALHMACVWIDRFFNASLTEDKSTDVRMAIATDKFLMISERFGFTPNDRRKIGIGSAKKPKVTEKRTRIDTLKPAMLNIHNGSH